MPSKWIYNPEKFPSGPPDKSLYPRKLTKSEIKRICDCLPEVFSPIKGCANQARRNIQHQLKEFLLDIEITPMALMGPTAAPGDDPIKTSDLVKEIIYKFERARVTPETIVGLETADAIGRSSMQNTLNSFHVSGSAKNVSGGLQGLQELINVSRNRKFTSCTIMFKNTAMSYIDTLRKRRDIVGIMVGDLFNEPDVEIADPDDLEKFYWHDAFLAVTGRTIPKSKFVMRIKLNVNKIFQYRITMERIASAIENGNKPSVICVCSPANIGIIDIYPKEDYIAEPLEKAKISVFEKPSLVYLDVIVKPMLTKLIIQGIPGISAIFPVQLRTLAIVDNEVPVMTEKQIRKLPKDQQDSARRSWYIIYSDLQIKVTGIPLNKLQLLLELLKFDIQEVNTKYKYLSVTAPDDCPVGKKPSQYINKVLDDIENREKIEHIELRKKGEYRAPLNDPIITASRLFYVDTNGTNLKALLSRPDVDSDHTYSNDFYEMVKCIGYLSTRTFYARELATNIKDTEQYVNMRYIELPAAIVFNRLKPRGLTFTGISGATNTLGLASFQKSVDVFARRGLFGKSEQPHKDTSASIFFGKMITSGTGSAVIQPTEEYQEMLNKMKDSVKSMSATDLENAVDDYENQVGGSKRVVVVNEEDDTFKGIQELAAGPMPKAIPTSRKEAVKMAPVMSRELQEILNLFSEIPGTPLPISPLRHGLLASPENQGPARSPSIESIVRIVTPSIDLIPFVFVESFKRQKEVKEQVVEIVEMPEEDEDDDLN
jgi:hypothetical protein